MTILRTIFILLSSLILVTACHTLDQTQSTERGIMFDDFEYTNSGSSKLAANGWDLRNGSGGPGGAGVSWSSDQISFIRDTELDQRVMVLQTETSGTGASTTQCEINTADKKYLEGTYAAYVYFTDTPIEENVDGDQIVETFFSITSLEKDMDPAYSELDFEYLANGGWGTNSPHLWNTSWETYQPDPWEMDATSDKQAGSIEGWHLLVFTVANNKVNYYMDGELLATHTGEYYPETPMSINFNLWIIGDGFADSNEKRTWEQRVDWVFHAQNQVLTSDEVLEQINTFRSTNINFIDTVK